MYAVIFCAVRLFPEWRVVKVSEHIERLVQLIKGAEGPETTGDQIDTTTASVEGHEDSDDEDNKIEEV